MKRTTSCLLPVLGHIYGTVWIQGTVLYESPQSWCWPQYFAPAGLSHRWDANREMGPRLAHEEATLSEVTDRPTVPLINFHSDVSSSARFHGMPLWSTRGQLWPPKERDSHRGRNSHQADLAIELTKNKQLRLLIIREPHESGFAC